MFADQMKMGDSVRIQLQCAHRFQGGEMKCLNCGQFFSAILSTQQLVSSTVEFTSSEFQD
jgi:hypothetical protein